MLEDALLLRDRAGLGELFAPEGVLAVDAGSPLRGDVLLNAALALWGDGRPYVADPRRVLAARDVALIETEFGVNVARRGSSGVWQYVIVRQSVEGAEASSREESRSWQ